MVEVFGTEFCKSRIAPLKKMEGFKMFSKSLASNDKSVRDKTLAALKVFIRQRNGKGIGELELMKLWKGLYYCMWMSDKRPVQQELASELASLVPLFESNESVHLFVVCFIRTMRREWQGLDHLRLDKFYSLVRCFVFEWFKFLCDNSWSEAVMNRYKSVMLEEVLMKKPDGFRCHVLDVFVPELEKLPMAQPGRAITKQVLREVLDPFYTALRRGLDKDMSKPFYAHLVKQAFKPLITVATLEFPGLDLNLGEIAKEIFDIAADADVSGAQRSMLYDLHKALREAAKKQGTIIEFRSNGKKLQAGEDVKDGSDASETKSSRRSKKRDRKPSLAAGQEEDEERSSSKKSKKEMRSTKPTGGEGKERTRKHVSTLKEQQRKLNSPPLQVVDSSQLNGSKSKHKNSREIGKLAKEGSAEALKGENGSTRKRQRKSRKHGKPL